MESVMCRVGVPIIFVAEYEEQLSPWTFDASKWDELGIEIWNFRG